MKGFARRKYGLRIWGDFPLKMTWEEMKRTWQGKWNNMKGKGVKGTEKTWLDMLANEWNEMETQRQSAKTASQQLEDVVLYTSP